MQQRTLQWTSSSPTQPPLRTAPCSSTWRLQPSHRLRRRHRRNLASLRARRRLLHSPRRAGPTPSTSMWLHSRRCVHLHRPGSSPTGTASTTTSGMLATGSLDPIRHTWSRVCLLIPTPVALISLLHRLPPTRSRVPYPRWISQNSMGIIQDCGEISARCTLRSSQ